MFLALSLSDVVLIMFINYNIFEQDKFRAQLRWAWKKFYNLEASSFLQWDDCKTRIGTDNYALQSQDKTQPQTQL